MALALGGCSFLLKQLRDFLDADFSLRMPFHDAAGFQLGVERFIPLGGIGCHVHDVDHECEHLHQTPSLPQRPTGRVQGCSRIARSTAGHRRTAALRLLIGGLAAFGFVARGRRAPRI